MGLISRVSSRTYRIKKPTSQKHIMAEGRLYVRGIFTGFTGGLKIQHENQAICKLEGVNDKAGTAWYMGKRVAYCYKAAKNTKIVNGQKSKSRVIWGRVMRAHGAAGSVKVKFSSNLPTRGLGNKVRIMLY